MSVNFTLSSILPSSVYHWLLPYFSFLQSSSENGQTVNIGIVLWSQWKNIPPVLVTPWETTSSGADINNRLFLSPSTLSPLSPLRYFTWLSVEALVTWQQSAKLEWIHLKLLETASAQVSFKLNTRYSAVLLGGPLPNEHFALNSETFWVFAI